VHGKKFVSSIQSENALGFIEHKWRMEIRRAR
jgi:hypothetical protein